MAHQRPQICRRGNYSPGRMTSCLVCPEGFFANYTGAEECEECPAGMYCPMAANRPLVCPAGRYRYGPIYVYVYVLEFVH